MTTPSKESIEIVAESMYQVPGSILLEYREMKRDPVAVVRRGVESGEIEGWFKRWCVKHDCEGLGNADRGEIGCTGAGVGRAVDMDCRLVPVLIAEVDGL